MIYIADSPYKDIDINFIDFYTSKASVEKAIPEATDFRVEERDSFGPLSVSFKVKGIRYWYA